MINDEQTHTLPADGEGLGALAVFLGYADEGAFAHDLDLPTCGGSRPITRSSSKTRRP